MFKREGGGYEGTKRVDDIGSEIRSLGVKELKRDGDKAVQLKLKATTEETRKISEAKNGGFEVEILGKRSARNAPTEED